MFAKLLKYEFKTAGKPLAIASVAAMGMGILGALLLLPILNADQLSGQDVLYGILGTLLGGVFLALVAYPVAGEILLLFRFYKNKFGDEGYLTFTLPATTHQILLSSILHMFIWSAIITIVTIAAFAVICIPLITYVLGNNSIFREILEHSVDPEMNVLGATDIVVELLNVVSSGIYGLILPLLSITIGCLLAQKHRILMAFAVGYGISMAMSALLGTIQTAAALSPTGDYLVSSVLGALVQLAVGIGGYFLMHHLIDKKLNI